MCHAQSWHFCARVRSVSGSGAHIVIQLNNDHTCLSFPRSSHCTAFAAPSDLSSIA